MSLEDDFAFQRCHPEIKCWIGGTPDIYKPILYGKELEERELKDLREANSREDLKRRQSLYIIGYKT